MPLFENRKTRRERKKHVMAYYPIMAVTCAIEFLLALSAAFLLEGSIQLIAHQLLLGIASEAISQIVAALVSIVLGACFMAAGVWTFSGFMRTLYDFIAWGEEHAADWAQYLPWCIASSIVLLDWISLGFRASFLSSRGEGWLLAFFLILPPLVWGLGVFMYILETIPEQQQLANLRQELEQVHVDELKDAALDMDPDLLTEWMANNPDAITTHHERIAERREEARQREEEAMAERDAKKAEAKPKPLPLPNGKHPFLGPLRDKNRTA